MTSTLIPRDPATVGPERGVRAERPPARGGRGRSLLKRHLLPALAVLVLGYLVITPLVRLQLLATRDGGAGYEAAFTTRDIAGTIVTTVALGLGSLAIALVLGTGLAWWATRLSPRYAWMATLPMLPIVIPPVAAVIGWAMMLSPTSGMVNKLIRSLPFYPQAVGVPSGPIDVFSRTWIIILTGLSLTSFIYVFIRAGLS